MSSKAIESLRARFEAELVRNASRYHEIDVERVRTEEWQVKRFLLRYDHNEDKAFEAMLAALQWKKEFGIHDRTDQDFPQELYEITMLEVCGRDRQGRVIQWERYRDHRNFKETQLVMRRLVAHCVERADREAGPTGFILAGDNGGMRSMDIELIKFKIKMIEHYPCSLKQLLMIDLPWLLQPVMKLVVSFMSPWLQEAVAYTSSADLHKYISPEYIHVSLGGDRKEFMYPKNLLQLDQLAKQLQMSDQFVETFYKHYKERFGLI